MTSSAPYWPFRWQVATVVPSSEGEQLEFYLTNGEAGSRLQEDKPGNAPLYVLPTPRCGGGQCMG